MVQGMGTRCGRLVVIVHSVHISEHAHIVLKWHPSLVNQTQLSAVLEVLHHQHAKEGPGTLAVSPWHLQECLQSQSDCSRHMTTIELTARPWRGIQCAHTMHAYVYTCAYRAYLWYLMTLYS